MKPYESYKETEIPWLKEIPMLWDVYRAKNIYRKENRPALENDEVVTCFRDGQVTLRKNRRTTGFTESIKEIGYQHIEKGDLVIHVMDAFAGAVGVSDSTGKGTPVYSVCTPKGDVNNFYFAYIVKEMAKTGFIQSLYRGIRERSSDFRFEVFSAQNLPVPPRSEQDQIVRYLDWMLSKINKLIKAKKKQIDLLNEQKQAIINKAVTKGLDDNVAMKDSGIEFLDDIPASWVVKPLKLYTTSNDEALNGSISEDYELDYIDISSVGFGYLKLEPVHYKFGDAPSRARRIVREGDTIISTVRTYLKSMCYINSNLAGKIVSTGFSVLRPKTTVFPEVLSFALCCDYFVNSVSKNSIGVSYPAISDKKLISLKIALPPTIGEQIEIYNYVQEKTANITKTIGNVQQEIDLITEYKISLISSVVTGKVDVRDMEIPDFEVDDELIEDEFEEMNDVEELEVDV